MFSQKINLKIIQGFYSLVTIYFFTIFSGFFSIAHAEIIDPGTLPNIIFHYDAQDTDWDGNPANEPNNNATLGTWVDTENAYNATQGTTNAMPRYRTTSINGLPAIDFDGTNDYYDIANQTPINTNSSYTEKSFATVFKTGNDVNTFQMIYEQWGWVRWYSFMIENWHIYAWVWNTNEWDNWHKYKSVDLWVEQANTVYFPMIVQDSTNVADVDNKLSIYLNWNLASFQDHVDAQASHGWAISMWRINGNTVKASDNTNSSGPAYLNWEIWEFVSWNHALTYAEVQWVQNYFADRWNLTLLTEVDKVPGVTTDTNPAYTFSTNNTGTLTYAWGCSSVTTSASFWDNMIILDSDGAGSPLVAWNYNDCIITHTDWSLNETTLSISPFSVVIDTTGTGIILPSAIANQVFHFDAYDTDGDGNPGNEPSNSGTLSTWVDKVNAFDATQWTWANMPLYIINSLNWWPSILFDGTDDFYDIANQWAINTNATFTEKSFATVFKTWDDVTTFQTIYEQWWGSRWYSFIVHNGRIYAWVWNNIEWDAWHQYKSVDLWAVEPNTVYFSMIVQDSNAWNDIDNKLFIYINGNLASYEWHVDSQSAHSGLTALWAVRNDTVRASDNVAISGDWYYFDGSIWEMLSWNHALTYSEIKWIQNYFTDRWNITVFYESQPVSSPTTNRNPLYEFFSDTEGPLSYSWGCNSVTNDAIVWTNIINFDSDGSGSGLTEGTYSDCSITLTATWTTSTSVISVTPFTIVWAEFDLTEITPVAEYGADATPDYTFDSPIAWDLFYSWDCDSNATGAIVWNNTITLNTLSAWYYFNCFVKVKNPTQETAFLHLSNFTISFDVTDPSITWSSPADNFLFPIWNLTVTFDYEDNVWGIWIDAASVAKTLHKWDWVSAYWADISGIYLTTNAETSTGSNYSIAGISFWKYKVSFWVSDFIGNNVTQDIIFYVDEITATISTGAIDIWDLYAGTWSFSTDELIITIETLGAAFDVKMNKTTLLQTGTWSWEQIPDWDSSEGFWYDQEVYSGTPTTITTDTIIGSESASLNTNWDKNSYVYKLKYWAIIDAEQFAWNYQTSVNFTVNTNY